MSRDIATQLTDDGVATLTLARPDRRNALSINLRVAVAHELCLTGRRRCRRGNADRPRLNRLSEPAQLLDDALAMARTIIEAPQVALEATKRYLISSPSATFE